MNTVSEEASSWQERTRLIFFSVATLTVFSFLSALLISVVFVLIGVTGMESLYNANSSSVDTFDKVNNSGPLVIGIFVVCQLIALAGWGFFIAGLYKFRTMQHSNESYISLGHVIAGCWMALASVLIILLACISFSWADGSGKDMAKTTLSIIGFAWIISIIAYSILLKSFKRLREDDSWNNCARQGAEELRCSAKYNIWLLIIPIITGIILVLTMVSHMDALQSFINKSWDGVYAQEELRNKIDSINSNYKSAYQIEAIVSFITYIILAIIQMICQIRGWSKIKAGGFQVLQNKNSLHIDPNDSEPLYCRHCGAQLYEDSSFCSKCGNPVVSIAMNETREFESTSTTAITENETIENNTIVTTNDDTENYYENDSSHRKAFLKWGGIGMGIIFVALATWLIWPRGGKAEEANVYVDYTTVFRTFDGDLGEDPLEDIQYGQSVTYYPEESGKEDKKWIKIKTEIDGKKIEGVVDSESIIPKEDFNRIDRAGLNNETVRFYASEPSYRRVIAEALKDKGDNWVLEVFDNGSNPPVLNYIETYQESLSPSPLCFGFVIRNIASDQKEFFLYSIDNSGKGTLVHTEDVEKNCGKIESISLNNGIITVKYQKGGMSVLNPSNEKEMDNSKDFILLQGEIDGQYAIRMDFKEEEGRIRGNYRYLKNNVPITIEGTYNVGEDGKKNVLLEETVDGKVTGNFIGIYDGITFSGSWLSADGERELPFMLTVCIFE